MWEEFLEKRGDASDRLIQAALSRGEFDGAGIGTPQDMRNHLSAMQEAGVDQVVFLQQAGKNSHRNICDGLELFAGEVMQEFSRDVEAREAAKALELAPYVEAALARKVFMEPLDEADVPVVRASVKAAKFDALKYKEGTQGSPG
jgi:hypothetical protein